MSIQFTAENHKYESVDEKPIDWLSVTSLVSLFKEPFDQKAISEKSSKSRNGKWKGMDPEKIVEIWNKESKRATDLGSWYHDQREKELLMCDTLERNGMKLPIVNVIEQDGVKFAPDQSLVPGIYPEHFVYLKSAGICGQADRVEVLPQTIDIFDYKTNKEIKQKSYVNWEGVSKKMLGPCSHLDDCHINHYALQLSVYMYIMLKHNHSLKPGKIEIHHITFEIESEDEYGYPIVAVDQMGDPIVKEVVPYELPYLKKEVQNMIKYVKMHPELIKAKKND
jgi:hypothetical protein